MQRLVESERASKCIGNFFFLSLPLTVDIVISEPRQRTERLLHFETVVDADFCAFALKLQKCSFSNNKTKENYSISKCKKMVTLEFLLAVGSGNRGFGLSRPLNRATQWPKRTTKPTKHPPEPSLQCLQFQDFLNPFLHK